MVASYPQVMQQLSQGNSEKACYSQVTVIHSHGLKHGELELFKNYIIQMIKYSLVEVLIINPDVGGSYGLGCGGGHWWLIGGQARVNQCKPV